MVADLIECRRLMQICAEMDKPGAVANGVKSTCMIITLQVYNLKGFKERLVFTLMSQLQPSAVFTQSICHSSRDMKALSVRMTALKDFLCLFICAEHVSSPHFSTHVCLS